MTPIAGILIGGASSRMGRPKALLAIAGRTLLERTIDIARPIAHSIVLLGAPRFDLPSRAAGLTILPDPVPDAGPLAGLLALLEFASDRPAILLACDMPRLDAALLRKLLESSLEADAAVPVTMALDSLAEQLHPCCALYNPSALPHVRRLLHSGERSMMCLLDSLRFARLELDAAEAEWLSNWNQPSDLPDP